MSDRTLELLHLEDSPLDQELIERELRRSGMEFESRHVTDREAFSEALDTFEPDVILSDFSLPSFNGLEALRMAKKKQPEVPFIFVSGALGEERAVELLREGASDYILKDRLQRLAPAVRRAKEEAIARKERAQAEEALKEERKFLERVLDCSGIVVLVLDEAGRIVRVNQGFTEVTGFSEQECLGSLIFDLIVAEDIRDQARTDLRRVIEEGSLVDYEAPLETKSRERRVVRWRADVLSSDDGIQIVASGVDLTDLRRAEEQHLQLESQLTQAQRIESLGRVAANVTHEFNNVLMGIQPFADIISRSAGNDERLQSCAKHISQSIQRGSRITREVLRFASPTEPVREHVRAGEWIRSAISSNGMLLGDRVEIALRIEKDHQISIDRSQLEQVVVNLLLNARDAMEEGGRIDVTVSTPGAGETYDFGVVESPQHSVWIEVRDQGPGVPAEIRDRMFEPFFTTKHKGTGLGLAVCHQIVHAHGGQIFVETELGEGTAFHLFLPRSE